jgi:hypothetical protein
VTAFPSSLLYKPEPHQPVTNADSLLDLSTAFSMLDALITAALDQLTQPDGTRTTLRYATKHNWVDRIHHYVARFASKNPAWRLHSLHAPRISRKMRSLAICSSSNAAAAGVAHRSSPRPRFCNHPGIWKCENPVDKSLPAVRLWDHMDLRLQTLQQRYPDLQLDVTVLSSQRLSSTSGAMRSTFYNYEALEIVVLTRGRRCTAVTNTSETKTETEISECSTVFVDDYRYERDIVQTNLVDWYGIISFLRGGAQTYVWLRLALLVYGAYAVAGQSGAGNSRLVSTALIVMKIPFQVIVYSSLLPVVGYVVALLLDSSFMDIFLDSYWASVGGSVNFDLVPFLGTTAVQMRNVWLLASLAILVVVIVRKTRDHWLDGVPGIRGLFISFTSTLTVLGPYKKTTLRNTEITSIFRVGHEGPTMDIVHCSPGGYMNASSYLFDDSASMLLFCITAVTGIALVVKILGSSTPRGSWIHREAEGVILSATPVAPSGARTLWPTSVLSIRFHTMARPSVMQGPRVSNLATPLAQGEHANRLNDVSSPTANLISRATSQVWPVQPGPRTAGKNLRPSPLGGVHCRTTEYRSILLLMNIAMMTDPWNLFWLRVLGIQLYLYKIHRTQSFGNEISSSRSSAHAVILPYREADMEEYTGLSSGDFQLLDSASSRDIPLSVLLQSG